MFFIRCCTVSQLRAVMIASGHEHCCLLTLEGLEKRFIFIFNYVCLHVCHVGVVPTDARRGQQNPWSWHYSGQFLGRVESASNPPQVISPAPLI